MDKKIYVIIGGKWFDKANGNTYCNAKILETDGEKNIYYSGYEYGYGDFYMCAAEKYIKDVLGQEDADIINGGYFYINKTNLKKNLF